jgi:hypothetical protein
MAGERLAYIPQQLQSPDTHATQIAIFVEQQLWLVSLTCRAGMCGIVALCHLGLLAECGCQLWLSEPASLEGSRCLPQQLQHTRVVHPGLQATTACSASSSKTVSD